MEEKFIMYGAIGAIVAAVMVFLNAYSTKKVQKENDGKYHLKLPMLYNIIGIITVLAGFVTVFASLFFVTEDDLSNFWYGLIFLLLLLLLGLPCVLYYRNHRVVFNDRAVTVSNVFGKSVTMQWEEIEGIEFKSVSGFVVLKTWQNQLKIHMHMVGLSTLLEELERRTKFSSKDLKMPF